MFCNFESEKCHLARPALGGVAGCYDSFWGLVRTCAGIVQFFPRSQFLHSSPIQVIHGAFQALKRFISPVAQIVPNISIISWKHSNLVGFELIWFKFQLMWLFWLTFPPHLLSHLILLRIIKLILFKNLSRLWIAHYRATIAASHHILAAGHYSELVVLCFIVMAVVAAIPTKSMGVSRIPRRIRIPCWLSWKHSIQKHKYAPKF